MTEQNPFRHFAGLSWGKLLPLYPADAIIDGAADLSEAVLNQRLGKAPAQRLGNGRWVNFKGWALHQTSDADLDRWFGWGANVGMCLPRDGLVFDIDILDPDHAETAERVITQHLGVAPCRVGLWPKRMLFYRMAEPFPAGAPIYTTTSQGDEKIELFGHGRQVALYGGHRKAGKPMAWPRQPQPWLSLPVVGLTQYEACCAALVAALPGGSRSRLSAGADRETTDQTALRARNTDTLRGAVNAIRNTRRDFGGYDEWVRLAAAIRGAVGEDGFHEGEEIFLDFSARSEISQATENPERVYRSVNPPFAVGAAYIYDLATRHGWDDPAALGAEYFDPVPERETSPFDVQAEQERDGDALHIEASAYSFPDPAKIPRREWIYGTHLIRKFVSATVAPSGVGKSSLVITEALAMASGKPLLGVKPKGQFRVWLWNGEDPMDELQRRVAAVMLHYGLSKEDVGDRLFLDSGRELEIVLATETRDGATIAQPVVDALTDTLLRNHIDVMQVDPFVSSHRVSENDNGAIDMVSKQWARIANRTGCAIDLVHHVRKLNGAEITVEDSRGAVSLIATSRSARALTKMQKGEAVKLGIEDRWQRFFRFGDGKNNLAPPAGASASGWMELVSVPLGNGGGDGMDAVLDGDSVGVVVARSAAEMERQGASGAEVAAGLLGGATGEGATEQALRAIRQGGGHYRKDIRAGDAWVGVPIAQALRLDASDKADRGKINALIAAWLRDGTLVEVTRPDSKRMLRTYVEAAQMRHTDGLSHGGVFE